MLRPLRLALAGLGLLLSADSLAVGERPNIVIFLADDLGRLETSVYGSKEVRTPNMEALARNGMTFNNAYVASPSCCPNRFSLLTGLMPARHGAHPNHSQVKEGTKFLLPRLQKLGYHVASFGKVGHGRAKIAGCDSNFPRPREMFKKGRCLVQQNRSHPRETNLPPGRRSSSARPVGQGEHLRSRRSHPPLLLHRHAGNPPALGALSH